jgi:hypothetical protein
MVHGTIYVSIHASVAERCCIGKVQREVQGYLSLNENDAHEMQDYSNGPAHQGYASRDALTNTSSSSELMNAPASLLHHRSESSDRQSVSQAMPAESSSGVIRRKKFQHLTRIDCLRSRGPDKLEGQKIKATKATNKRLQGAMAVFLQDKGMYHSWKSEGQEKTTTPGEHTGIVGQSSTFGGRTTTALADKQQKLEGIHGLAVRIFHCVHICLSNL